MKKNTLISDKRELAVLSLTILFILLPLAFPGVAANDKTELFSADKDTPLGFTNLVEPNVMIFIDTSGSMAYYMHTESSTYGDGTNPKQFGNKTYYNYGADRDPGNNQTRNNNASVDTNYHPLMRYIEDDNLLPSDKSKFSYDVITEKKDNWSDLKSHTFSNDKYRLDSSGILQINTGTNKKPSWSNVGQNDSKPAFPSDGYEYQWEWRSSAWYLRKNVPTIKTTTKYKYPNDSRLYALKNVMYRILDDPSLVGNLRLALATFNQTENKSGKEADHYRWSPTSSGTNQYITWKYPSSSNEQKRAILRSGFASTTKLPDGPENLKKIQRWFDGFEGVVNGVENPELRADGATPLASSIWEHSTESVKAYYSKKGAITDWCQDNWLIIVADGNNDDGYNAINAVKNLHDMTITLENGRTARKIKTFVIGVVDPDSTSSSHVNLRNNLNAMAREGKTEKAYFATDVDGLLDSFRKIFQEIQDFASTGSAPLVNPPSLSETEGTVYSTGFKPRADQQWMGYLYNYSLIDGKITQPENWEAGKLLKTRSFTDRKIYTADWDGQTAERLTNSNLKLFNKDQSDALRPLIAGTISKASLSDAKLKNFIDWIRGSSIWDDSSGDTFWKFGDPYHVGLVEVGPPKSLLRDELYKSFKTLWQERQKLVYVHSNDGMVHAFLREADKAEKPAVPAGTEKWAFLPPNVMGYRRLLGLKADGQDKWVGNDKYSNPKYLLDGPIVAEDVYFDDEYRTVLLGSLGRAGAGMYALDITKPDTPKMLWALENNFYDHQNMSKRATKDRTFLKWEPAGSISGGTGNSSTSVLKKMAPSDDEALGRLRLTVSTPFIGTVDKKESVSDSLTTKWVALFGAGVQFGGPSADDPEGGKAVYVVDIRDGTPEKELTHDDLGMVVAPISAEASPRPMKIGKFYLGDNRGAVFEGDLTSPLKKDWKLERVFTPGNSGNDINGIPFAVEVGMLKNSKWLFWGTGDPDGLFGSQTGTNNIVALRRNAGGPNISWNDLQTIIFNDVDSVSSSTRGWRMPLDTRETVTTPPVIAGGKLYVATYIPVLNDNCEVGNSKLYVLDAITGRGGWGGGKKFVELNSSRISGITLSEGRIYIGITRYPGVSGTLPGEMSNVTVSGNLMILDDPQYDGTGGGGSYEQESKTIRPTYWRDWRP